MKSYYLLFNLLLVFHPTSNIMICGFALGILILIYKYLVNAVTFLILITNTLVTYILSGLLFCVFGKSLHPIDKIILQMMQLQKYIIQLQLNMCSDFKKQRKRLSSQQLVKFKTISVKHICNHMFYIYSNFHQTSYEGKISIESLCILIDAKRSVPVRLFSFFGLDKDGNPPPGKTQTISAPIILDISLNNQKS